MARRGPNSVGEKRDRILRAAVKIFSRKGFFNSKVSEIARAAEVADGTIYLYFRNKDDLLISLFEEKMGEVVADVRRRIADGVNALEKLKIFIENHMDLLEREAGLVEVLQVELRQSTKFRKDYTPVKFFEYLEDHQRHPRRGQERGGPPPRPEHQHRAARHLRRAGRVVPHVYPLEETEVSSDRDRRRALPAPAGGTVRARGVHREGLTPW